MEYQDERPWLIGLRDEEYGWLYVVYVVVPTEEAAKAWLDAHPEHDDFDYEQVRPLSERE
jgi:hypothetical protein